MNLKGGNVRRSLNDDIQNGTLGMKSHKHKIVTESEDKAAKVSKHAESNLHLQFCKWVKATHPNLQFVRHEREKSRSYASGNLMKVYNSDLDKLPDFELLENTTYCDYSGLYIEFKKPGREITLKDGITIGKEFIAQYRTHMHLWSIGRCVYFCNDLEQAKRLLIDYLAGNPQPMQKFVIPVDKKDEAADDFLTLRGL